MENQQPKASVEAHPLFFDSLFPSFQPTTPETVVSDYRQRKRADSRAEHNATDDASETKEFSGSNVEFYAEIVGKLIGTIRDGVTSLIDDVKQRKLQTTSAVEGGSEMKSQKLKTHRLDGANMMMDVMELHRNSNAAETNKMNNEFTSARSQQISTSTHDSDMMKGHGEVKLTTLSMHPDVAIGGEIQSADVFTPDSRNEVIQVIAKRTKHKRSDTSLEQLDAGEDNGTDVRQLEIPFGSEVEMTNERVTTDNQLTSPGDARWFTKHREFLASVSENHRRRTEKLFRIMVSLLSPSALNDTTTNDVSDDDELTLVPSGDESNLSFAVMRGNSTILHVTPRQLLRMFHRGSDEHAGLQSRAKMMLQRAFYKYARLYLLARKGYKDARSFNRMVHNQLQEDVEMSTEPQELQRNARESHDGLNEVDDDDELNFMTNDARNNFPAVEAFAILILEIFGAMMALSLGAISQIQAGYG